MDSRALLELSRRGQTDLQASLESSKRVIEASLESSKQMQSDLEESIQSSKRSLLVIQSAMAKGLALLTREKASTEHRVTVAEFRSNLHFGEKRRLQKALEEMELSKNAEVAALRAEVAVLSAEVAEMKPHYDEAMARRDEIRSRMERRLADIDKEREQMKKALEMLPPNMPLRLTDGRP